MLFGQHLRYLTNLNQCPVMYTAPNNPLHFVSTLRELFNSLEPTQARDQVSNQAYVDQGLMDAAEVWLETMDTNHH